MTKIYRYNEYKNTVQIKIYSGKIYGTLIFDHGNAAAKIFPTVTVKTKFWQQAIEESKLYKDGIIKCVQSIVDGSQEDRPEKKDEEKLQEIAEVDTLEKAVDYLANNYQIQVKTKMQARREARNVGISFPNLQ